VSLALEGYMTVDTSLIGTMASIISLALAFVFWQLASRQAEKSDRVLNEIKDQIMSWQSKMNNAAISLIEARPEVIAQKVALAENQSNADFINRLASIIETLSSEANEQNAEQNLSFITELLKHQKSLVLESERIKAQTILGQQSSQSE